MVKKFEQEIRSRNEVGQSEVVSQFDVEADEVGQSQVCQSVRRRDSAMIRKIGVEKCRTIAYFEENGQFEIAGQFDAVTVLEEGSERKGNRSGKVVQEIRTRNSIKKL